MADFLHTLAACDSDSSPWQGVHCIPVAGRTMQSNDLYFSLRSLSLERERVHRSHVSQSLHSSYGWCRRFGPREPSIEPTSEFIAVCRSQMGWRKMEHKGKCGLYYLAPGVLVVVVTSVARERVSLFVCSSPTRPSRREGPRPSFYRCKERVQVYNGGVAMR
jgi:hypothetical protein